MIRSLVAPLPTETDEPSAEFNLRRNLTMESLEKALEAGDTVWIDLVDPEEKEIRWLEKVLNLHPSVVEDLFRDDRRPAMLVYPTYLFLSLFQPHIRLNQVEGREVHCLSGEKFLVTVRKSNATAVDEAYKRAAQSPDTWRGGASYFLYLTVQNVVDAYYPPLDRMSNHLNEMENEILANGSSVKGRKAVYSIKQQLIHLRQMIAPQREVLSNVIGEERLSSQAETRELFRHLYERLLRVYDVIDSQRDLSSNVLDLMESQQSRTLVEAVNRLTILSMIFLPLTFFTGFFQLNFTTTTDPFVLPFSGAQMLFVILILMLTSGGGMVWFLRRKGLL